MIRLVPVAFCALLAVSSWSAERTVVGSKTFGESHVLGEIIAQLLEARGFAVERKLGLGGTLITYEALRNAELDVYPEYTGTLIRAVFQDPALDADRLARELREAGLDFRVPLGFQNNYAIAVPESLAQERGLTRISDLRAHPDLRFGFTHEFLNREDGWPAIRARYELPQQARGLDHALAYRALASGELSATDAYTTDGELDLYELRILEDDLGVFPAYHAGLLTRAPISAGLRAVLGELEGRIDEARMRGLNRRVAIDGESPAAVAGSFLLAEGLVDEVVAAPSRARRILRNTLIHLKLTSLALLSATSLAVPLALMVSRRPRAASATQYVAGLIQTIPALALLALLIPLLGLGQATAIFALFLYSLLPIVRNTITGIAGIDPLLKQVAEGMGLTPRQQLLHIELPLALPTIIAGIKTAAIISIGTATLAAFVGAGGLGEPIITGLSLSDNALILEGALPAAALAILAELVFEWIDRRFLPAQLRG